MRIPRTTAVALAASALIAGCGNDDPGPGPEPGPAGRYEVVTSSLQYDPPWIETVVESTVGEELSIAEIPDETWLIDEGPRSDEITVRSPSSLCAAATRPYNSSTKCCTESEAFPIGVIPLPAPVMSAIKTSMCNDLIQVLGYGGLIACSAVNISSAAVENITTEFDATFAGDLKSFDGSQGVRATVRATGTVAVPLLGTLPFNENLDVTVSQLLNGTRCERCSGCASGGGSGGE
jgi:hypothetical protein